MEKIKKKIYLRACKRCADLFRSNWRASYCEKCNRLDKWREEKKKNDKKNN